jgi:hypothetical protein
LALISALQPVAAKSTSEPVSIYASTNAESGEDSKGLQLAADSSAEFAPFSPEELVEFQETLGAMKKAASTMKEAATIRLRHKDSLELVPFAPEESEELRETLANMKKAAKKMLETTPARFASTDSMELRSKPFVVPDKSDELQQITKDPRRRPTPYFQYEYLDIGTEIPAEAAVPVVVAT